MGFVGLADKGSGFEVFQVFPKRGEGFFSEGGLREGCRSR